MTPDIHITLKFEYFDQIKAGTKREEYRLVTLYWAKRLIDREYRNIVLHRGYTANTIIFPWREFHMKTITHPHFGPEPVKVFAIRLEGE